MPKDHISGLQCISISGVKASWTTLQMKNEKESVYHVLLRDGAHALDVDVDDHIGRVSCVSGIEMVP